MVQVDADYIPSSPKTEEVCSSKMSVKTYVTARPRSCSPKNRGVKMGEMIFRQFNSNIRQIYRDCTTHVGQFYPSAFGYNASCDVVTQFSSYVTVPYRFRSLHVFRCFNFYEINNTSTALTSFTPCHEIYFSL
jgi:hypothetical protein